MVFAVSDGVRDGPSTAHDVAIGRCRTDTGRLYVLPTVAGRTVQ